MYLVFYPLVKDAADLSAIFSVAVKERVLETHTEERSLILSTLHIGFSMTEINHS
jgi:hypothetical protein